MATLPASPPTLPSASAICPDGTATTTTSASVASPPSRPTAVTAWPARSQRRASPPPTLPLPSTKMFTLPPCRWPDRRPEPVPTVPSSVGTRRGADLRHDLADSLVRSDRRVHSRPTSTSQSMTVKLRTGSFSEKPREAGQRIVGRPSVGAACPRSARSGPAAAGWPAAAPAPPDPLPGSARTSTGSDWSDSPLGQVQGKLELVEEVRRTEAPEGGDGGLGDHLVPTAPAVSRVAAGCKSVQQLQADAAAADLAWSPATYPARVPSRPVANSQVITWPTPPASAAVIRRWGGCWPDGAVLGHADPVAAAVGHRDRLRPRPGRPPGRGHRRMRLATPGPHRPGRIPLHAAGGHRTGRDRPAGQ